MSRSYYTILNIATNATQRDIKVAYRKLVQKHHPDVNSSGSDELIKQINVAYETLSDPTKKAVYDQQLLRGHNAPTPTPYGQTPHQPRTRRRPPPAQSFYRYSKRNQDTYIYSTKTKLQGWGIVILAILLIVVGLRAMHIYAANYYFEEAEDAVTHNEYNKAFGLYKLAIRDWGNRNVDASIKIVELNQQMESYYAMIDNVEKAFSYEPDSTQKATLYYLEGIGFVNTKQYKEAELAFIQSLKLHYNKDSIYQHLGPIDLYHLSKYKQAAKIYTYLLIEEANNEDEYFHRGITYQYLGEHTKAINDFLIILKENPNNGKILFQLGRSYLALNQKDIGCQYLRKAQNQGANIDSSELALACDF